MTTDVSHDRWLQAQATELKFAVAMKKVEDDWNLWWADKFDGYRALSTHYFGNILEVGCGPNTNFRVARPKLKYRNVYLEDPLIAHYLEFSKHLWAIIRDKEHRVTLTSEPLERLPFSAMPPVYQVNLRPNLQDA